MSTPATPAGTVQMTQEQLKAMIAETATEAVGPAVKAALEPHTKAQGDALARIAGALKPVEEEKGFDRKKILGKYHFGRAARALALGVLDHNTTDPDAAMLSVKKNWPAFMVGPTLKWLEHVKTTLAVGNPPVAGDMIIPQFDEEWIELLRNTAVVRGLPGVRTKSMPRGAISQRKQTGSATATYQGELGPMVPSNLTVGKVNMSYKKLTSLTVVSNDLLRFGGPDVDQTIQDDLLAVSALREDQAFLVGNPPIDAGSPQGIRFQTLAANISASAGTSLANFQTDVTSMIADVQKRNLPVTPSNSGFLISSSNFWRIYALTTTTGDWTFKAGLDQAQPQILGFPVYVTTQLEVTNSFIGANAGMLIFAHFPSLVIWDSMARTVETYRGGAYRDDAGTVQSGISNDETVITCIAEHDFQQRYAEAASIRTGLAT